MPKRFIAINEDGTGGGAPGGTGSRDDMAARNRDGSIWLFARATRAIRRRSSAWPSWSAAPRAAATA